MAREHDDETLAFYDREAAVYAARARRPAERNARLEAFLARLAPGASILELGTGGGQDAEAMIAAGFEVAPTDGSAGLAVEAQRRLGRPVRVMRFEALDERERYDAVWANASLLHVPEEGLADVLARVCRALKRGGLFFASFKGGDGGGRDRLGRYYNFVSRPRLEAAYGEAGAWIELSVCEEPGGGYDGVERTWLMVTAVKG
ncbi:MAG TPA: class I SAM-dependent methyltransferase [Caulobacteraceae bacterium]|jgi:SAM-dependent methyltransferase|nr:class I SAM-dependent methyltransferase [Caulobacteraceae bacterium]